MFPDSTEARAPPAPGEQLTRISPGELDFTDPPHVVGIICPGRHDLPPIANKIGNPVPAPNLIRSLLGNLRTYARAVQESREELTDVSAERPLPPLPRYLTSNAATRSRAGEPRSEADNSASTT